MNKLAAMEAFVRIVDQGSLTAAAAALDTSLPSVVRTLAALERELGVRLLNRTTRRIHLTDEGAQYLERCRAILGAVQESEALFTSRRAEPQGRLAVTASVLFGRRYVAPIVSDFLRRHPKVSAELLFVDRVVNLIEEGMDVAVRIARLPDSSLVAIPVGSVRRVVCASPAYLRRHGTPRSPQDLRAHACIRHTGNARRTDWQFRVGRRTIAVPVDAVLSCSDIDSSLDACINGHGLGMFLSYQTAAFRKEKSLTYVLEDFETEPVPVQVVYAQSRLVGGKVRAFVDECVSKLRAARFE
ncbi:MAG TPA: LysR family transcriptional regulator [Burkholderiales bacterium]|jgi:DNA-binding transcriptional LysR family regulator|nr:LysR family transcriptional regulator [Burkholderiales bacterium]